VQEKLAAKISPYLWFDNRIEEAVNFYVALFGGKIHNTLYWRKRTRVRGAVMK